MGDMVPLTPLVREYVEGLGQVHETVRRSLEADVSEWETTVQSAMEKATQELGNNPVGFVMVRIDAGDETEEAQLFPDVIERRRLLTRRSQHAANISRHYVSGLAVRKDASRRS